MDISAYLLLLIAIFAIYRYLTKDYDYWKKQNIPFIRNPIPGFGHLLPVITLNDSMINFTREAFKKTTSSMIGFYFMRKPALVIREAELVKSVLQSNFSSFCNNVGSVIEKHDRILAKNPFFAGEPHIWKDRRAYIMNHLSSKKLKQLQVIVQGVGMKMCKFIDRKIKNNGQMIYEVEMKKLFSRCTAEITANAGFGIEGQSFDDEPGRLSFFNAAEQNLFYPSFLNNIKQNLLLFMPDFANLLGVRYMPDNTEAYMRENIKAIIKQRRQQNVVVNDYLQYSIDSNGDDDLDSIIADVVSFYLDVYETSSNTMANLFYHLTLYPEIQEKLRGHIISKLQGNAITYESLKEMNYLEQVLHESMRLLVPVGILMKRCTKEVTLTGSDGLKCHLKPGYPVIIPVLDLHIDERYWPNPEVFDPERFHPENQSSYNKFAFLAFGEGPRLCVGMRFGMMLMKNIVATLLTEYSIGYSTKNKIPLEVDPTSFIMVYKNGIWAKFTKINNN